MGRVINVSANTWGIVWCVDDLGRLWVSYPPAPGNTRTWAMPTNGIARQISVNDVGDVYCVNKENQLFQLNLVMNNWELLPGITAQHVSIGTDGTLWRVNDRGKLLHLPWWAATWSEPDPNGIGTHIAYENGQTWCVNAANELFRLNTGTMRWEQVPGIKAQSVAVGATGEVWITDDEGRLLRGGVGHPRAGMLWQEPAPDGDAIQVSIVNNNHIWCVNSDGNLWELLITGSGAYGWSKARIPFPDFTHTVRQGEWLAKIARDYRVSVAAILAANPGKIPNPDRIEPGLELIIPR